MASLVPVFEIGPWNGWIFMVLLLFLSLVPTLTGILNKEVIKKLGDSEASLNETEKKVSKAGNLLFYVSLIFSIFLPLELGTTWLYAGLVVLLVGIFTLVKAVFDFAQAPVDKPATKGIYRISRNPMYLGIMLVYLATSIACASWVFLILTAVNVIILYDSVKSEERFLLGEYGQTYRDYMAVTPRWIGLPKKRCES